MPDAAPADPPAEPKRSLFEKLGAGLPVALTAIATVLAGLSTGELSRAMYWRSTAAQDQGKANDQWSLAGFKRDRAMICETTADTLWLMGSGREPSGDKKPSAPEHVRRIAAWMNGKGEAPTDDPAVKAVLQAVHERKLESEVIKLARSVDTDALERQINAAAKEAVDVESYFTEELTQARQQGSGPNATRDDRAAATAHRYEIESRRYKAEATANQWVGFLYEVRVKTSTAESERHRQRSENFFFAMLAAQVGGVVSSLALARKRRSVLWLVAGLAGLAAVGFGAFVYLTM